MSVFRGTGGDDTITGTSGNDNFLLWQGGSDTVDGGDGNDIFRMGAALNAGDKIDGGTGNDAISLNGDYSASLVFNADTIANIEVMALAGGHSYNLTLNDGNVAADQRLLVKAQTLGAGDHLTFDGSAETDGNYYIIAGAGDDTLTGGARHDVFDLSHGGNDTAHGGGGNDTFLLGGAFTAADRIDGGAGNDTLSFNATYAGTNPLVLSDTAITSVETLEFGPHRVNASITGDIAGGGTLNIDSSALLNLDLSAATSSAYAINGSNTANVTFGGNFTAADVIHDSANEGGLTLNGDYSGGLTLSDTKLSGMHDVAFEGAFSYAVSVVGNIGPHLNFLSNVSAGHTVSLDLSQTTSLSVGVNQGGAGTSSVKFAGNFFSGNLNIGSGDLVIGGTLELDGDYSSGLTFATFSGGLKTLIEVGTLKLDDGFSYKLTMAEDNFGTTLTVDASTLTAGHTLNFDGLGASGILAITGGAGNDTIKFAGNFFAVDTINGGAGTDAVELNGDYSAGLSFGAATMTNVETLKLDDGFSYKLTTNDGNVATGATLSIDASALTGTHTLTFDGSGETDGSFVFEFAGNFTASDSLTGGAGTDTLELNGDYSLAFGASTIASIEIITVAAGHNYNLSTNDANVAAGATLTVDASALTSSFTLDFSGGAEIDGHFAFIGGAGADLLSGGSQSDTFDLSLSDGAFVSGGGGNDTFTVVSAARLADDFIDGGTGSDTLILNGDFSAATAITASNVVNIETLQLLGGTNSYNLAFADGITTALTVDASAAASLTFDGSGNTTTAFAVTGSAGNDSLTGGANNDSFDLTQGGNDTASGGNGNDTFTFGGAFTTSDTVNGGGNSDTISLNGDYSAGVVFGATTMTSVENIVMQAGHSYNFTSNDANVASLATLTLNASALGAADSFTFDGTAETNGGFAITGGAGDDTVILGSAHALQHGTFDGGAGNDTLELNVNSSLSITFGASNMQNVETLKLDDHGPINSITTADGCVAAGATLTVDASALTGSNRLVFNGQNETDGNFHVIGGAGNDNFESGNGGDVFTGGGGVDTVFYTSVAQSTSTSYDTITDIDFGTDRMDLFGGVSVPWAIDTAIATGALSTATFDGDLAAAVKSSTLAAHDAVLFTADSGTLSGHTFLVVDENGAAGYQVGADLVIDVTGYSGILGFYTFT